MTRVCVVVVALALAPARPVDADCDIDDRAPLRTATSAIVAARRMYDSDIAAAAALARCGVGERDARRFDAALTLFDAAIQLDGERVGYRLERAVTLAFATRLDEAFSEYDAIVVAHPENLAARNGRARIRGWLGDRRGAEREFRATLARASDDHEALVGLADVLRARLRRREAAAVYRRALAADPLAQDANDGLIALATTTRVRIRSGLNFVRYGHGQPMLGGGVGLVVHASDRLAVEARYELSGAVLSVTDPAARNAASAHLQEIGFVTSASRVVTLDSRAQWIVIDGAHRLRLGQRVSLRAMDKLVLQGGARVGVGPTAPGEWLADVGVLVPFASHFVLAQAFASGSPNDGRAISGVITAQVAHHERVAVRVSGSLGRIATGRIFGSTVRTEVGVTSRSTVHAQVEVARGAIARLAFNVGLEIRR